MDCLSGWCKSKKRLEGCTVIVTGSNTGIGKETVLDMYKRGARVIMACRDISKAETAKRDIEQSTTSEKGTGVLVVEKLDLSSMKSVREFVDRINTQESGIYALINNAGVMMCPQSQTEDGFETHIGSNHLGHALLTILLLPTLISSEPSRIVFVSSYLHAKHDVDLDDLNFERKPYNAYEAYCRSKAANVLFSKALSEKLKVVDEFKYLGHVVTSDLRDDKDMERERRALAVRGNMLARKFTRCTEPVKDHSISNVTTYSLHPGVVRTEISRNFDKTVWNGTSWLFNNVLGMFLKSPACGAQTTIFCAVDDSCADQSGLYYSDCCVKSPSKQCQDSAAAAKLWDLTVSVLKLGDFNPFGK